MCFLLNLINFWHDTNLKCKFSELHFYIADEHEPTSSDDDAWEEREASRTHSVKFSEDSGISDKDTPFVRQNTPHPKELKLKAHKLFGKDKSKTDDGANLDTLSEEVIVFVFPFFV